MSWESLHLPALLIPSFYGTFSPPGHRDPRFAVISSSFFETVQLKPETKNDSTRLILPEQHFNLNVLP